MDRYLCLYLYLDQRGMLLRVSGACRRQLLQISPPGTMLCKTCVTVALCLVSLLAFSEGFFLPASLRKQAPQTTYNGPHWIPTPTVGTINPVNTKQTGFGNPKDFPGYQQQQPQSLQQQQQQQQSTFSSQLYASQPTAPKYEPTPFQSVNQPQYVYEGAYTGPLNSYAQSVQLVPCLCPVNREVLEQQGQQLQQQTPLSITPTSSSFPGDANNSAAAPPPQPSQKKTT